MGFDSKAFAAAVLDSAVKRYIKIVQEGKTYTIQKDEAVQGVLPEEEQMAAESLFKLGDSIELKNDNHVTIAATLGLLSNYLNNRYAAKYFSRNTGYSCLGFVFSVVLVVFLGLLVGSMAPGIVVVFAVLLLVVNAVFFPAMKCVTIPGRRLLDKIEGLRMYLTTAEQDRLNTLNPPERTPQLFEKFLPYALALDVEQEWAEQFTEILAKAGEGGAAYSPAWYHGTTSWREARSAQADLPQRWEALLRERSPHPRLHPGRAPAAEAEARQAAVAADGRPLPGL